MNSRAVTRHLHLSLWLLLCGVGWSTAMLLKEVIL